jgi:hypothetical protein
MVYVCVCEDVLQRFVVTFSRDGFNVYVPVSVSYVPLRGTKVPRLTSTGFDPILYVMVKVLSSKTFKSYVYTTGVCSAPPVEVFPFEPPPPPPQDVSRMHTKITAIVPGRFLTFPRRPI